MDIIENPPTQIEDLLEAFHWTSSMKDLARLAAELSRLANQDPPWTGKYVHSVLKGYYAPSPEFARALECMGPVLDGKPPQIAGAYMVRVLVQDKDQIPDGVVFLPVSAGIRKCARPGCPIWFIKTSGNQKYHDPECRPANWEKDHKG